MDGVWAGIAAGDGIIVHFLRHAVYTFECGRRCIHMHGDRGGGDPANHGEGYLS